MYRKRHLSQFSHFTQLNLLPNSRNPMLHNALQWASTFNSVHSIGRSGPLIANASLGAARLLCPRQQLDRFSHFVGLTAVSNRQNDRPTEKLYYVKTSIIIVAASHIQLVLQCGLKYKHNIKSHLPHLPAHTRDAVELLAEMDGMNL